MKHLKKIAVALVLFVATTGFVNAQSKVAHINVQQLLTEMPEMKAANAELQKLQESLKADIQGAMTEYQSKATQYNNEAASKTKEENDKRMQELANFEKNIGQLNQTAQQDMAKKQQDLYGPITEKAKKAIEKIAAAQGFNYVLDASPAGTVIVATGKDLMADVKKELGF